MATSYAQALKRARSPPRPQQPQPPLLPPKKASPSWELPQRLASLPRKPRRQPPKIEPFIPYLKVYISQTKPFVATRRSDFLPELVFAAPQHDDLILRAAKRVIRRFTHATLARFVNPLQIEPILTPGEQSKNKSSKKTVPQQKESNVVIYAICRVGLMATVPLCRAIDGEVLVVKSKNQFTTLMDWLGPYPSHLATSAGGVVTKPKPPDTRLRTRSFRS